MRLRNATGEIKKSATPEASSLDYRGAVTGKGGKGGKGSKGGKGADSGKGGKGGKASKGGKGGKGAQGTRPPWGCFVCGNTALLLGVWTNRPSCPPLRTSRRRTWRSRCVPWFRHVIRA